MENYIREALLDKFEFHNYGHALEILSEAFPNEWNEIQDCLENLTISTADIMAAGGNETAIPKKFDDVLYPLGWREIRITGDLLVKLYPRRQNQRGRFEKHPSDEKIIEGYIDGHNIDFIKGKVAFDLEWNSKDQTFDRDLLAMRTYFDCGLIEVGVIVTRSKDLDDVFKQLGRNIMSKYGASTTWMGKLEYRLKSRRNGGCPILAVGIKKACVEYGEE
ncbi:MAG: hypothetical protein IJN01_05180 [Rikenellaceae bacterium]|nr:hypothetical protein [Rikenellaceae bacterium]